jgi:hypothetical protein
MQLTEQEMFFYVHAGYSYKPGAETPDEGHERSARQYALAETWAHAQGLEYRWQDDWMVQDHVAEYDCYDEGEGPETCESCLLVDPRRPGKVLASLGCIDDATSAYRRVVQAELALEIMPEPMPAGSAWYMSTYAEDDADLYEVA